MSVYQSESLSCFQLFVHLCLSPSFSGSIFHSLLGISPSSFPAYSLKQSRDLVRAISAKLTPRPYHRRSSHGAGQAGISMTDQLGELRMALVHAHLPPVRSMTSTTTSTARSQRASQLMTSSRHHQRSRSAPATISTTELPAISAGNLHPPSRMLLRSVVGLHAT